MRKYHLSLFILAPLAAASLAIAQSGQEGRGSATSTVMHAAHVMVAPDKLTWVPAPPGLPPGSQVAVLEGDPSKTGGHFAMRAKMPDGYKIPPHWHPTDERIVVLQGTLGMGMGEKFDAGTGRELPAGSYAVMPAGARHFAWAKGETVIQVSAAGPFEITYVNPADDPRKTPK